MREEGRRTRKAIKNGDCMKNCNSDVYGNKRYSVCKSTKKKMVSFGLSMGHALVGFSLSYNEWKNFVNFFRMTIKKKWFYKNAKGHVWFIIDKNKVIDDRKGFSSRFNLSVHFELGRVRIQMHMDELARFRKFCLDANEYLFRFK
jgi:hypothetical protein